ncbi:MAG: DUF418 domain-containing protein [Bacteroidales bacterium]
MLGPSESSSSRLQAPDLIRGLALGGILLVNVWAFALPTAAGMNPTVYGDLTGWNRLAWIGTEVLARGKFLAQFSLLFGAGLLLFSDRATERGQNPVSLHVKRMVVLGVIGLLHAYLLWEGDVLVTYSLCGTFVFLFRNHSSRQLLGLAALFFLLLLVFQGIQALQFAGGDTTLQLVQRQAWNPTPDALGAEILTRRSGGTALWAWRAQEAFRRQTQSFVSDHFWRISGLMFLGAGLFRSGMLGDRVPGRRIRVLVLGAGTTGMVLTLLAVFLEERSRWDLGTHLFPAGPLQDLGSVGLALGYLGILLWWVQRPRQSLLKTAMGAMGRLALTIYLLQSLCFGLLFRPVGLGLFGKLDRLTLFLLALFLWILFLAGALWYERTVGQGPVEQIWRTLYRGRSKRG